MTAAISRGSAAVFSIRIGGKFLTLVSQIYIAVSIGLESFGHFVFAISIAHVLIIPAILGLDRAVLRLIPEYAVKNERGLLHGLMRRTALIPLFASLAIAGALAGVVAFSGDLLGEGLSETFYWTCLLLPLLSLTQIQVSKLLAFRRPTAGLLPFYVIRPVLTVGILFSQITVFGFPADGKTAIQAYLLSQLIVFIVNHAMLRSRREPQFREAKPQYATVNWLSFSLQLLLVAGFVQLLADIDIIMVGALLGTSYSGIYGAATRIAAIVALGLHSVNTIISPLISRYHTEGDRQKLQQLASSSCLIISLTTVAGIVGIVILGEFVLSLFGGAFVAGYLALLILTLGQLINALTGSVNQFINLTGHQTISIFTLGGSVVLNIILNALLIPVLGINGAAVSTAFSVSVANVVMMIAVRRKLGIDSSIASVFKRGHR